MVTVRGEDWSILVSGFGTFSPVSVGDSAEEAGKGGAGRKGV